MVMIPVHTRDTVGTGRGMSQVAKSSTHTRTRDTLRPETRTRDTRDPKPVGFPVPMPNPTFCPCFHAQKGNAFCRNHSVPATSCPLTCVWFHQSTNHFLILSSSHHNPCCLTLWSLFALFLPRGSQWPMTMYMVSNSPIPLQFPC